MKNKGLLGLVLCLTAICMLSSCARTGRHPLASELEALDAEIGKMDEYVESKERRIAMIESLLTSEELTLLQQYNIYGQLYQEYEAFQFDKAKEVLEHQERIAEELGDASLGFAASLNKAHLLSSAGLFLEASQLFSRMDTTLFDYKHKISWYNARQRFLHDYQEYVQSSSVDVPDAGKVRAYQDLILKNTPDNSSLNRNIRIMTLIEDGKFEEAYEENARIIAELNKDTREFAVQAYWQGFICENLERSDEMLMWWIESARCDIRGAIKDNAALCSVAIKIMLQEETDRAFRYIRLSLDDALFYNAKLRKVQIASTMPWIEQAYWDSKEEQTAERNQYLFLITIVAVMLLGLLGFAMILVRRGRQTKRIIENQNFDLAESYKSIADAEDVLRKTNLDLIEANAAKEEYLGLFLSMCSGYLDKLKKTISREQYEAELRNFYKTFDTSFLSLYPTFVEDFNSLLKEDARVLLKDGELLNTGLRIFALIKLGITQSSHIASLLRYSVNTIYNYRAQVKNAALSDRENFEDNVRKIGSKRS